VTDWTKVCEESLRKDGYTKIKVINPKLAELLGGEDFILVGGAIGTVAQYENFDVSSAHFYPEDDAIMRYWAKVGTSADIELVSQPE